MKIFVQEIEPELIEYLKSYNINIDDSYSYPNIIDENNNNDNMTSLETSERHNALDINSTTSRR